MPLVNDVKWVETLTFRFGVLGALVADRYARALAEHDLKPKHVGLLSVLDAGLGASQLEIAKLMRVAPSLVVSLADHLEAAGAVERLRDPADRRRQILRLTDRGHDLLARCTARATALDAELTAGLTPAQQAALGAAFDRLAAAHGLPLHEDPDATPR
ncbi:MarR family winged helix-turn-helix transcriptional regulator [Kitasatospora phosalacinea]|uniref:MarR family winged helix-turn-helix transcriptional regulator n=1 Tax=Kitasatospora phosalacinea TaxID=2065 RepID=UPI0005270F7F|nr:MarR family transcriptional regulator [Kitasatospora phosalacinea]